LKLYSFEVRGLSFKVLAAICMLDTACFRIELKSFVLLIRIIVVVLVVAEVLIDINLPVFFDRIHDVFFDLIQITLYLVSGYYRG